MTARMLGCLVLALLLSGCTDKDKGDKNKQAESDKKEAAPSRSTGNRIHLTGEAQRTAGMAVSEVRTRPVPETLTVAGQIAADESKTAHIGSYVAGRVVEASAAVGDRVHAGQVLARMHSHEVHETLAAYQMAQKDLQRQRAALDYNTRMRDRMKRLYGLQYASTQEVEKSEADLRAQETSVADAEIALEREATHLSDVLRIAPDQIDKIDEMTERVPVLAPMAGIVTARMITPGTVVEPGQEVYTVADIWTVWMLASVSEPDIAKVRLGSRGTVHTQAYPDQEFAATVARMGAELDPKTRTLPVRLTVPNAGERLRVGMYASAELHLGSTHPAIFVPEAALQDLNGGTVVFVRNGTEDFEARPVEIGKREGGEAEVRAGLHAGEQVVVKSSFVAKSELLKSQIGE